MKEMRLAVRREGIKGTRDLNKEANKYGICHPIATNPLIANDVEDGADWAELHGTYNHQAKDWASPGSQW